MVALRDQLARKLSGSWRLDRATDEMVIEQSARLLSAGLWHVHASDSLRGRVERVAPANGATPTVLQMQRPAAKSNRRRLSGTAADQMPALKSTWIGFVFWTKMINLLQEKPMR
jgi:hypothetical protein